MLTVLFNVFPACITVLPICIRLVTEPPFVVIAPLKAVPILISISAISLSVTSSSFPRIAGCDSNLLACAPK